MRYFAKIPIWRTLNFILLSRSGAFSRFSTAVQHRRRTRSTTCVTRAGSPQSGTAADTHWPWFRRNGHREGSLLAVSKQVFQPREGIDKGGDLSPLGRPIRIDCGKVTNRTSQSFRPVSDLHRISCRSGPGPHPKRRLLDRGVGTASKSALTAPAETKKREFQRQASDQRGRDSRAGRDCWELFGFDK
jgi:hypothetical protein